MLKMIYKYVLPALFTFCFILSLVFDSQRNVVLVLAIIAFLLLDAMIIISLINLIDYKEDFLFFIIALILLFWGSGKFKFEIDTISGNNYGYIVLATILLFSIYKVYINRSKAKPTVLGVIIYIIMFLSLWAGVDKYYNYAFDLTQEVEAELVIEQQVDDGHGLPGYTHVFIEYSVETNDFKIDTIDISDEFKLKSGDKVKIIYRKGVYTPLYTTEYDVSMWIPAPFFSD